uniref:Uncharacterized protein n=1 Tax=Romanomermis culicivorax TaxID=13658 RepID=A0A915I2W1_ROMCU
MLLPFMFFMFIHASIQYAFESCTDDNAKPFGNCTVRQRDGAIGSESVNTVILKDGYLDMGLQSGCPFVNDSCRSGFSFYGWLKVFDYPKSCDAFAIYVSSGQFNIHILGNGHLAAYVWMANDTEWYVESLQPILLNIFYPVVLQFHYFGSKNGSLQLILQDQLSGVSNCSQFRTYKPPKQNLVFGGDGVSIDHSAYVQLDRSRVSNPVSSIQNAMAELIDPPARQSACSGMPRPFCFNGCPCPQLQQCLVTRPVQQTTASETSYLNTQNQCYTSQIINLKATITEYYLNYNLQWESQVRQNFTLIWNKWHAAATTDVSEWKLCLNVALNIKIMLYYKNVIFEQISIKIKIDQCVSNMVPIVDIVQRLKINYNKKELIDWSDFFDDIDDLISFEN